MGVHREGGRVTFMMRWSAGMTGEAANFSLAYFHMREQQGSFFVLFLSFYSLS